MNHGDMGHGHGGGSSGCTMNTVLTTSTTDLCILVPGWRITSRLSLWTSLALVVLLGVSFEAVREQGRRYGARRGTGIRLPSREGSPLSTSSSSLAGGTESRRYVGRRRGQAIRAVLYGVQVAISFLLMLVFMTYNVYIMAAVVVGSVVGYYCFNEDAPGAASKGMACH